MMNKVVTGLCGIIGVAMIGFGIFGFFSPHATMQMAGITAPGIQGMSEARAIYGGMFLPMGAIVLCGLFSTHRAPLLLSVGLTFVGVIAARLVSIAIDGYDPALNQAIISEVVLTAIILLGVRPPASSGGR